jgi:hypothetical protein
MYLYGNINKPSPVMSPTANTREKFVDGVYVSAVEGYATNQERRHAGENWGENLKSMHKISGEAPQWLGGARNAEAKVYPSHCKKGHEVSIAHPDWMTLPGVPQRDNHVKGDGGVVVEGKVRRGRDSAVDYNPLTLQKLSKKEREKTKSVFELAEERTTKMENNRPNRTATEIVILVRDSLLKRCKASGKSAYLHKMFRGTLRLFRKFDVDMSGTLNCHELVEVINELGVPCNLEEARSVVEAFDKDGNGEIDYNEFLENTLNIEGGAQFNLEDEDDAAHDLLLTAYPLRGGPHGFDQSVSYDPISFEWRMNESSDFRQHVERLENRNKNHPIYISPEQVESILRDKLLHVCGSTSNLAAVKYLTSKYTRGSQNMSTDQLVMFLRDAGVIHFKDIESLMKRFGGRDGSLPLVNLCFAVLGYEPAPLPPSAYKDVARGTKHIQQPRTDPIAHYY